MNKFIQMTLENKYRFRQKRLSKLKINIDIFLRILKLRSKITLIKSTQ